MKKLIYLALIIAIAIPAFTSCGKKTTKRSVEQSITCPFHRTCSTCVTSWSHTGMLTASSRPAR